MPTYSICICGQSTLELSHLLHAAKWLDYHRQYLPDQLRYNEGFRQAAKLWQQYVERDHDLKVQIGVPLRRLIIGFRARQCSDPRDKVYAMLGMLVQEELEAPLSSLVRPNYGKSHAEVIRDATRYCLRRGRGLRILGYISFRNEDDIGADGFPSWVPRLDRVWDSKQEAPRLPTRYSHAYLADGQEDALSEDLGDPSKLQLEGFFIDDIQLLLPLSVSRRFDRMNKMREDIHVIVSRFVSHDDDEAINRLARTLVADCNWLGQKCSDEDLAGFRRYLECMETNKELKRVSELAPNANDALAQASRYFRALYTVCHCRKLMTTSTGVIGLAPRMTRASDIVVYLYGGDAPFILRPTGDEYQLLGECYVDGVMYDEEVEAFARTAPRKTFVIR